MSDWKAMLKADPTDWLLQEENPSVRYFTLKDILGRPADDAELQAARQEIMLGGRVPEMLNRISEPEYVQAFARFYTNKYEGLVWQLIALAELGADANAQIKEQCEYLLAHSQEPKDGGFSQHASARVGGGLMSEVIPCLTGNMVWCLIRFGYLDDERLQKGIGWITRFMRFNDGVEEDPQVAPYSHYDMCWGAHTCHMGVVKALKALNAIPTADRTPEINDTIRKASEFMLIHHIHKRSHNLGRASKPGWLKFGFPLAYQTDTLEILDILTELGIKDARMEEAIAVVRSKQGETGRWCAENTYCGDRLLIPFEPEEADKWVTLRAMRVLKRWAQL